MGAIRDFLDSVGRTKTPYTGSPIPGPPPADTASTQSVSGAGTARPITSGSVLDTIRNVASNTAPTTTGAPTDDRAAFDESVRKYQLDRRAYEQYNTELNNRLRNFNPYADAQYRVASTTPPAGATSVSVPTAPAPTAPTQLRAPTYGAISQFSNLTPQQQGELYLQQRNIGYTDADIRKATAAQVGTPNESTWTGYLQTAYPDYTRAVEQQYGTLFNRTGFGGGAQQIDNPGFNYWVNQLSSGAVAPQDLASSMRSAAATTPTPVTTPGTTAPTSDINALYQQYFNRQADPGGLQYWQQSGLTGDALRNAVIAGAQGPDLDYYNSVYNRPNDYGHSAARGGYISKYAEGGRVRTHYQTGGETELYVPPLRRSPAASPVMSITDPGYLDRVLSRPVGAEPPAEFSILDPNMDYGQMYPPTSPRSPAALDPNMDYGQMYPSTSPRSPAALALMPIEGVGEGAEITGDAPRQRPEGLMDIEGTGEGMPISPSGQRAEPTESRQRNPTLAELLARNTRETPYASEIRDARSRARSEASAFADLIQRMSERGESPTSRAEMYFRLASAFGAPTRTGSIGETLSGVGRQMGEYTQGRRAEEAERRALAMRAGEARLGGTRQDLQTLLTLSQQESQERRAASNDLLAQANLAINQARLGIEQARRGELAPDERQAVRQGRARVNAGESALKTLEEALALNPNTYDRSFGESAQRFLAENLSPRNPTVLATRTQENLLGQEVIDKLRASFGTNPTEGERIFLRELSGINARSREERAAIIQRGIARLRDRMKDEAEEIQLITSGRSRQITQD